MMKPKKLLWKASAVIFSAILLSSCTFDNEEELGITPVTCDTSDITYSQTVVPLLGTYGCTGCHSGSSASAGIRLDSYDEVVRWQDRMIGSIRHDAGFSRMPRGGGKMSDCEITQIETWLNDGSPNN